MPQRGTKSTGGWLLVFDGSLIICAFSWLLLAAGVASAQKKQAPLDPNKFAVIINGAGGEPVYAKQFEE